MTKYILIIALIAGCIAPVFWADWIIQSIFNKDINNWVIFGSMLLLGLVTPRALNGVLCLAMVAATLYIWVLM